MAPSRFVQTKLSSTTIDAGKSVKYDRTMQKSIPRIGDFFKKTGKLARLILVCSISVPSLAERPELISHWSSGKFIQDYGHIVDEVDQIRIIMPDNIQYSWKSVHYTCQKIVRSNFSFFLEKHSARCYRAENALWQNKNDPRFSNFVSAALTASSNLKKEIWKKTFGIFQNNITFTL